MSALWEPRTVRLVELRLAPTLLDPSLVLVIQDTLAMESRARVSFRPRPQSKSPANRKTVSFYY